MFAPNSVSIPFATRPFAATGYELANLAAEASQHASAT